jgi:hypothetical protein
MTGIFALDNNNQNIWSLHQKELQKAQGKYPYVKGGKLSKYYFCIFRANYIYFWADEKKCRRLTSHKSRF